MHTHLGAIKGALLRPLRAVGLQCGWFQLHRRGYDRLFAAAPPEAFRPDWADLWFLYRTVRRRRPAVVLELGAGCSTAILAVALRDNGQGHLYSVESDPRWAEVAAAYIPAAARSACTLVVAAVETATDAQGTLVRHYASLPAVPPDLVYVDGPPLTADAPITDDVLRLALAPRALVIVDGRKATFHYLRHAFGPRARTQWRPVFYNGTVALSDRHRPDQATA